MSELLETCVVTFGHIFLTCVLIEYNDKLKNLMVP